MLVGAPQRRLVIRWKPHGQVRRRALVASLGAARLMLPGLVAAIDGGLAFGVARRTLADRLLALVAFVTRIGPLLLGHPLVLPGLRAAKQPVVSS